MWRAKRTRNVYKTLVGRLDGRRTLGRSGHIWDDNIKIDLTEIA
jgi:hypothetical protein